MYHNRGYIEEFYDKYGPEGTNTTMAFMLEADSKTNRVCLTGTAGCVGGTAGNWTKGVKYPILDPEPTLEKVFHKDYNVNFWPNILLICPDKKIVLQQQATFQQFQPTMGTKCSMSTSIQKAGIDSRVSVYPNITAGGVNVGVGAMGMEQVKQSVHNAFGGVVYANDASTSGPKEFRFDPSSQPNGLYYVKVTTAAGFTTRKIVLSK